MLSSEECLSRVKEKYGDRYRYDKAVYVKSKLPIVVTCPKHGDFKTNAGEHLTKGTGCPACAGRRPFKEKAEKKHGNSYDYSKVNYKGAHTKIEIICKEHGSFWQTPANHLAGRGCPQCTR